MVSTNGPCGEPVTRAVISASRERAIVWWPSQIGGELHLVGHVGAATGDWVKPAAAAGICRPDLREHSSGLTGPGGGESANQLVVSGNFFAWATDHCAGVDTTTALNGGTAVEQPLQGVRAMTQPVAGRALVPTAPHLAGDGRQ